MKTYSSRPMICKDGPDANGFRAEVKVVKGCGYVDSITPSDAGKAAKISFKVENTKYASSGWIPMDQKIYSMVEEAKEAGEPIEFRIETRRKDSVDRHLPILEIGGLADARDKIVKSLAAVKRLDDEEWTVSPLAKTRIDEDPTFGSPNANDFTLEELRAMEAKNNPAAGGVMMDYGFEGSPREVLLPDGSVKPSALPVGIVFDIYRRLDTYSTEKNIALENSHRVKLVEVFMRMAGTLQVAMYKDLSQADMTVSSFERAVDLVFDYATLFSPLTRETVESPEALEAWTSAGVEKMGRFWHWSMTLVKKMTPEGPAAAQN